MNRPYPTYTTRSRTRRFDDSAETDMVDNAHEDAYEDAYDYGEDGGDYGDDRGYRGYESRGRHRPAEDRYNDANDANDAYDSYDDAHDEVYEYVDTLDRRWIWVAGAAGAVLLVAVICTIVILGGGDSGSVSATVSPPTVTTPAVTAPAAPSRTPSMTAPATPLPAETVTTVAPSPPVVAPPAVVPPAAVAPPVVAPKTVTYRVTGTRPLIDLVTVIYTDAQGALQTDVNVALPWTKSVVLDPGVSLGSVTATSLTGQLNCTIADGAGAVVAAQTNNSMITTCTK